MVIKRIIDQNNKLEINPIAKLVKNGLSRGSDTRGDNKVVKDEDSYLDSVVTELN